MRLRGPGYGPTMSDSPRDRIPGYIGAMATLASGIGGASLVARATGRHLPNRFSAYDLVTGGIATHKLARLITKDGVTTPIRAPFTEFEGAAGSAEVNERPKEGHPQHTIGELLTCPFCMAPWLASGYVVGLAVAPRFARAVAAGGTVVAISDFLQHAYARVRTE